MQSLRKPYICTIILLGIIFFIRTLLFAISGFRKRIGNENNHARNVIDEYFPKCITFTPGYCYFFVVVNLNAAFKLKYSLNLLTLFLVNIGAFILTLPFCGFVHQTFESSEKRNQRIH